MQNCTSINNTFIIDAFLTVRMNSKLLIDNSTFIGINSMSRGGVILADY